jgi:hypothetical protein
MIIAFSVLMNHDLGTVACWIMCACIATGAWVMMSFYGRLKRIEHSAAQGIAGKSLGA